MLGAAIEMSTVLGLDADRRPVWQDRKEHLAPFPTAAVADPRVHDDDPRDEPQPSPFPTATVADPAAHDGGDAGEEIEVLIAQECGSPPFAMAFAPSVSQCLVAVLALDLSLEGEV